MIELDGINREFMLGDQVVHALQDITLTLEDGEYISVMGPSGSGKSTLLNIIALLDRPNSGTYHLNNIDVTQLDDDELARIRRENIGFVFQFFHLIPRLTAAENVELPLILAGEPPEARRDRVEQALRSFDLLDRAHHRPEELSGGQRQRTAIARAIIMQPGVLLADEPTGNLDQASGRQVVSLLEELNGSGVTLIVVTHDADIGHRARRRLRLVDGRVVQDDRDGRADAPQ